MTANKRLYRSRNERLLLGVCGGIAAYLDVDPTIVRLLWVLMSMMGMPAPLIAYLVLVFVVPLEPNDSDAGATKRLTEGDAADDEVKPKAPAETKKLEQE